MQGEGDEIGESSKCFGESLSASYFFVVVMSIDRNTQNTKNILQDTLHPKTSTMPTFFSWERR